MLPKGIPVSHPEYVEALHTYPMPPLVGIVMVVLVLPVKFWTYHTPIAGLPVAKAFSTWVTVPPLLIVGVLIEVAFVPVILIRIRLGLPTAVLKPEIVQPVVAAALPLKIVVWFVSTTFARAAFGKT